MAQKKFTISEERKAIVEKVFPILRFQKNERYTPTNFIELCRGRNGDILYKCTNPKKYWDLKSKYDRTTKLRWYMPSVFVHFLEDVLLTIQHQERTVPLIIQFYYYFAFNEYHWGPVRVPFLDHIHDWEMIQVAINKNLEILAYSISGHGTVMGLGSPGRVKFHKEGGFACNLGAHNFGSIYQIPNRHDKDDIILTPESLIPTPEGERKPFKDSIIYLDSFESDFLWNFAFTPVRSPWRGPQYDSATFSNENWSWSPLRIVSNVLQRVIKV